MLFPLISSTALAALCAFPPAQAQEKPPATPAFVVHPVETELQRLCLAPSDGGRAPVKTFVAIHGSAAVTEEGLIDPALVPASAVRSALERIPDRQKGTVVMYLYFGTQRQAEPAVELLTMTFDGVGRRSGFKEVRAQTTFINGRGSDYWDETAEALTIKADARADEEETPAGDELIKVYPVRTALSLLLTDKADCVVDVRAPLAKKGDDLLAPEIRDAIVKHASTMKFRDTGKVLFRVNFPDEQIPRKRFERFLAVETPELTRRLGFKNSAVQLR